MVLSDLNNGENSFRRLSENLPGIVYRVLIADDNRMIFFNDMIQTMTGYNPEDLEKGIVCSIDPLILPEDRLNVINIVKDAIENNVPFEVEYRINNKSGELKWFFERGRPIRGDNGNPCYIDGVIFDITERKEIEQKLKESEKKFKLFYENAPLGYLSLDFNGNILEVNKAWINFFGYSKEEVIGKFFGNFIDSEYLEVFNTTFHKFKETGEICEEEFGVVKKDGSHAIVLFDGNISYDENGNFKQIHCIFQDITERKKTEEKLKESEQKYKDLANLLPQVICETDVQGNLTFVNQNAFKVFGYTQDDFNKGLNALQMISPKDRERTWRNIKRILNREDIDDVEYMALRKDGSLFPVIVYASPIIQVNKSVGLRIILIDASNLKKIEEELRKSEERYRYLIENSLEGVWVIDSNANTILINPSMAKMLGYIIEEMVGKSLFLFMDEKEIKNTKINLERRKKGISEERDSEMIHKNGKKVYLRIRASPIFDIEGNYEGTFAFLSNITQRKLIEQNLIESEEKFRNLTEQSLIGVAVIQNNVFKYINQRYAEIGGYTVEEMINWQPGEYIKTVHPADREKVMAQSIKKQRGDKNVINQYTFQAISKTGEAIWIELYSKTIMYESRLAILITIIDITDRKKAEQNLKESEERFRDLANSLPQIISESDKRGNLTFLNKNAFTILGYTPDDFNKGLNALQMLIPEDRERVTKNVESVLRGKKEETIRGDEYTALRKDGSTFPVITYSSPIIYKDRSVGMRTITIDITDQKKTEQKLKSEKEKAQKYLDIAGVIIIVLNADQTVQLINQKGCEILEGEESKIIGMNWFDNFIPENVREQMRKGFNKIINGKIEQLEYFENAVISKNGKKRTISWHNRILKNKAGKIIGTLSSGLDITARKQSEENLKESEEKYRYLFDNAQVGLYWSRISDSTILECNNTFAKLFGYDTREECLANYNTVEHYIDPNARSEIVKEIRDNKEVKNYEIHVTRRDDTPIWLSISARMFEKENRIEGAAIDITERKQAERELQLERDNFLNILNSMEDGVYIVDQNYDIEFVNPSLIKEFGQFEGMKCFKYFEDQNEICPRCKNKEVFQGKTVRGEWFSFKNQKTYDVIDTPLKNPDGSISKLGIFRDETRKKQAEKIIKESKEKFRKQNIFLNNILESLTHPFYVINADDYAVTLTNSTASSEGLKDGQYCYSLTHNNDKPCEAPCKCPLDVVKETKRTCVVEHTHYDKEGNEKIYEIYGYPIMDERGNVVQMIEYALNITDRKKAENNLRKIAHQWRTTFDAMSESVFLLDIEQNILQCNKATLDILRKEKYDEIIGHSCCEIMHGTNEPVEWCPMIPMIESSHKQSVIAQLGDKWCEISVDPVINDEGTLIGAVHIITDITERRKAERKLIESEEKFRTITERALMGIIIMQDNQIKYVNDALLNIFGYSQKEIINWEKDDLTKLIHPEDLHFLREYLESLRSGETSLKPYYSYRIFTKLGKMKWIDQLSKEIQYKGKSAELISIMDITEKKEAEQELIKLHNMKSELLRRTSHELKTPLVSIKGFSDLLLELHRDKLDDYVIRTIEQIRRGCNRLGSLVNDILKTSELESGTVELKKSKEDLSLLIRICVNELEGLAELRNHTINLEIHNQLICSFEKDKIYNVITNILSNAIKFTPSNGKIEVKTEINNDFIIFSIRDNGIGFTKEERSLVFKQFGKIERYGQGYDVLSEGSGLGLYISKKIIEMHGGEIWVESEGRDKGTTFYFSLPII